MSLKNSSNELLSLTNLSKAQMYFNQKRKDNKPVTNIVKKEILESFENQSTRECEKKLLALEPESNQFTKITINISKQLQEKLNNIKSLISHKNPNPSYEELLAIMAEISLDKLDITRKQLRSKNKFKSVKTNVELTEELNLNGELELKSNLPQLIQSQRKASIAQKVDQKNVTNLVKTKFTSQNIRYIPSQIKKNVWLRANSKCEFTRQNQRCESRHRLEIEHIRPIALGGDSKSENLKLYCKEHNQMMAYRNLGRQ